MLNQQSEFSNQQLPPQFVVQFSDTLT